MEKICSTCKVRKSVDEFYEHKGRKLGVSGRCKECGRKAASRCRNTAYRENPEKIKAQGKKWYEKNKEYVLQYKKQYQKDNAAKIRAYNRKFKNGIDLSAEDEQKMIDLQNNLCFICNSPPKEGKRLLVDHNHTTGEIRKLLCNSCNVMVGMSYEDTSILQKAINYLQSYEPDPLANFPEYDDHGMLKNQN